MVMSDLPFGMVFVSDGCRYSISTDRLPRLLRGVENFFRKPSGAPCAIVA
jgi:hypothetical protein